MIIDITADRKFLTGVLAGLTVKVSWYEDAKFAPAVGTKKSGKSLWSNSNYVDTITSTMPRECRCGLDKISGKAGCQICACGISFTEEF